MAKEIDHNEYWYIKENPITKEGIFPYLGKQISDELEPEKIYQVYRPLEELRKAAKTFKLLPIVDDHTMLGAEFTPAEEKGVHGVTGEEQTEKDGTFFNDIKLYSEKIKELIKNGKKELSLGYFCNYDLTPGEWHGRHYDAVQRNILGNHLALVQEGRMGHDVCVMDSKKFCCDSLDLTIKEQDMVTEDKFELNKQNGAGGLDAAPEKENNKMDKRELVREIMAISAKPVSEFSGGEEERTETIAKLAEKIAYNPSEASKADDACVKDAEPEPAKEPMEAEKDLPIKEDKTKALDERINKAEKGLDEMPSTILKMMADRETLYNKCTPLVGAFDHAAMTTKAIAMYACERLGLKVAEDDAVATLNGYVAGQKQSSVISIATDSKEDEEIDTSFEKFMKEAD